MPMLQRLCLYLFSLTWLALAPGLASAAQEPVELVFLNWAEYLDPELVAEFEARYNAVLREVYFETDDTRDQLLVQSEGRGFDLMLVNGTRLQTYRKRDWLAPLDAGAMPNLDHIDPRWVSAYPAADGYAVPYFWGTLGIAYRADLVPAPLTRWQDLLDPHPALHDRILMIKDSRDIVGAALKSLGHSVNTTDAAALEAARRVLLAQKPHVGIYGYPVLDETSPLVTGEIAAAMLYNGDALMVQAHHPEIQFRVPEEGSNLWVDYITVSAFAEHPRLAMAFIDFLNEPANAARLAEYVYYATPNRAAEALLPEDFLQDPVIYPTAPVLERSEYYRRLPPQVQRTLNDIFAQVLR